MGMSKPIKREGGFAEFVSIPNTNIYEITKRIRYKRGICIGTNRRFIARSLTWENKL